MASNTGSFSRFIVRAATSALLSFALLLPANAQFWVNSWGGRQQQPQQPYNPYAQQPDTVDRPTFTAEPRFANVSPPRLVRAYGLGGRADGRSSPGRCVPGRLGSDGLLRRNDGHAGALSRETI